MRLCFLGGLSSIGGSCLLIEDVDQAMLIDAGASGSPNGYALPDFQSLIPMSRKLRAVFFTHAHYDHAGGAAFLHDLFPNLQVFGSRETLAFLHGRYALPKTASASIVHAGETFALGNWQLTPHAAMHSIPGTYSLSLAAPSGNIFISADFKAFSDPAEIARCTSPDIFVCESTNAGLYAPSLGDAEVEAFLAECIARHREARILFSCFSTNLVRLGAALRAARRVNMKIYVEGKA
ncbi:MAG: MBL fold metallo-hydrolase, partial [Spirochaetota bacterium]|nr:MBL fold metallo-hydrolase [Spirochaetota bacterium]